MELVELSGRITGRLGYDYRLRHRRDGNAGTTILYHLRNRRRPHSSSGMTAGRQGLLGMGTAAASAGAAGPSEGLRAGWSSGRTEAGVHRGERTTHLRERADDRDSEPDYLLRPTRRGPDGNYYRRFHLSGSFIFVLLEELWTYDIQTKLCETDLSSEVVVTL